MTKPFYKCDPFNFVPLMRTPWAGEQISLLKKRFFPQYENNIPRFIGESWEVSTDSQFPSKVELQKNSFVTLTELLSTNPSDILGENTCKKYGPHFPLLLKWLEANDLLSVQLHPDNSNPRLKENECGKPEAWLVLNVNQGGFVYLGFKKGLSKEEIVDYLRRDEAEKCLYKYFPKPLDYISVPPGCVHAVGPGVLLMEPQYVLPGKNGKTWRISDWRRFYDETGKLSANGKPRELHVEDSFSSINWDLPRETELEKLLIQNVGSSKEFAGDLNNPFALKIFNEPGEFRYKSLVSKSFSLFSVWDGQVLLKFGNEQILATAGESGFICAQTSEVQIFMQPSASIAFFALAEGVAAMQDRELKSSHNLS